MEAVIGSEDLTTKVLVEIRDEIRVTRSELKAKISATNQRLDQTNERLERVERRQVESEMRITTELVAVRGATQDVHALLRDRFDLRDRVDKCERDIGEIKQRLT